MVPSFWSLLVSFLLFHGCSAQDDTCTSGEDETCASPETDPSVLVEVPWGEPQETLAEPARRIVQETKQYMTEQIMIDPKFVAVRETCRLEHKLCSYWASIGECESNPGYMIKTCAPACQSCEQLDYGLRCPFDGKAALWKDPGEVEGYFSFMWKEYYANMWSRDPWVLTLDDFLTSEECQTLIDWGAKLGYERSVDAGPIQEDGSMGSIISEGRTSLNAWCVDDCYKDEVTQRIVERLQLLLEIPSAHFEYFQLLKYEKGEFYRTHNDFNGEEKSRPQGNRILTVYLYLNDVPAGGGTRFPKLNVTVTPKLGRALIWPSVLDRDPFEQDGRTDHEALPVEKGVKYGSNIWVHQRDFITPFAKGCI